MRLGRRIVWTAVLIGLTIAAPWAQEGRRDEWQNVEGIFAAMQVKPGAVVGDVGAGDGYFTMRLAEAIGARGRVYAVDVNPAQLVRLRTRVDEAGLKNVEIVQGDLGDPKLPAGTLDAALIVNAYHEMSEYASMLGKIKAALKPDGRLVIVEPISEARRHRPRAEQTKNHEISLELVLADAREAGFVTIAAQDPFVSRPNGHGVEWMVVLTPARMSPTPAQPAASVFSSANEGWKSPDLRISMEDFKKLAPENVLVLDVRDPVSYRQGHLPGAILMTPEELSTPEGQAKLRGETRQIVAYCS
jgi:predicted methyltransferase